MKQVQTSTELREHKSQVNTENEINALRKAHTDDLLLILASSSRIVRKRIEIRVWKSALGRTWLVSESGN